MDLELHWRGPIGPGNFPTEPTTVEDLNQSGIYLRLKIYQNGRCIAYVGQSQNLLSRFEQHIRSILSLQQLPRDNIGFSIVSENFGDRFNFINKLSSLGVLAIADAERTKFYFALARDGFDAEYLRLIEAMLKTRAEEIICGDLENIQDITPGEFDHDITISNNFSRVDSEGYKLIESVIGHESINVLARQELG